MSRNSERPLCGAGHGRCGREGGGPSREGTRIAHSHGGSLRSNSASAGCKEEGGVAGTRNDNLAILFTQLPYPCTFHEEEDQKNGLATY